MVMLLFNLIIRSRNLMVHFPVVHLTRVIATKSFPTITQTTLDDFVRQKESMQKWMEEQQKMKALRSDPRLNKKTVNRVLATATVAGLIFIGYRILTRNSNQGSTLSPTCKPSRTLTN